MTRAKCPICGKNVLLLKRRVQPTISYIFRQHWKFNGSKCPGSHTVYPKGN